MASELQPNPELRIESAPINFGYLTDHLADQAVMHCSQLRFHPAWHVEAGSLPFLEGSIPVERLGRDRNHEEVARKQTNPTTMAGLTLLRLRSVNGIGSRTTSFLEQRIEDIVSRVVPHPHQRAL